MKDKARKCNIFSEDSTEIYEEIEKLHKDAKFISVLNATEYYVFVIKVAGRKSIINMN